MAKDKNSFILYKDLLHTVEQMPKAKAGDLFLTILRYVNDQNPEVTDSMVRLAFEPVKQQLKRDLKKWEATRGKRSEAGSEGGKKSGEVRRSKMKQNEAGLQLSKQNESNEAVSVSDTVSVSVSERENSARAYGSNFNRQPVRPTLEQVQYSFTSAGGTKEMAESFYNKYEATDWYKNGSPIVNYSSMVGGFIKNWNANNGEAVPTGGETKKMVM